MLDEFEAWFEANRSQLSEEGISVEMTRREVPTGAICAVLEGELFIASVICWETGSLDVDALSRHNGESLLSQRYDFRTSEEILLVLKNLHNQIKANLRIIK